MGTPRAQDYYGEPMDDGTPPEGVPIPDPEPYGPVDDEAGEAGRLPSPPRRGNGRRRSSRPRSSRKWLVAVGVIVVIGALAAVGVKVLGGGNKGGNSPSSQASSTSRLVPKEYVSSTENMTTKLNDRSKDSRPVNRTEIFGQEQTVRFPPNHPTYTLKLVGSNITNNCNTVTWGSLLQKDLKAFSCSQIVRGVYQSTDKKYVGEFIVVNLESLAGAQQILRDLNPQSDAGFVFALNASGVTFSSGFSAAYSSPYGHFAVINWVERANGRQPDTMNELLDVSVAVNQPTNFIWARQTLMS
jgi:hypothetical protein